MAPAVLATVTTDDVHMNEELPHVATMPLPKKPEGKASNPINPLLLRSRMSTLGLPEGEASNATHPSSPTTTWQRSSSLKFIAQQTIEQTKARRARLIPNERSGVARGRARRSRSPVTPAKISHGGVDKKSKRSGKATESKLSSELERLLVGDELPAGQTQAPNRMQHPLRAVLHNLPGFTFGSELDSVKFRKRQRVIVGIDTLMAEGGDERGKDLAREWLEGFLLLTFETIANVLERYRMCKELDDVPLGFITMARDVETKINSLPDDPLSSPDDPSFKSRRAMESRLCQSNNLQKLVEWTISARRRFLEHKPKSMPGFGTFVQAVQHEGSDLEKRLWAAVDAQARKKDV
ncbi:hypothetical protein C8034_v001527 [Colletotrichum sidae]|uniref:Uncharacterized protein n=1 Tax=Colletotrichum sidae TaxID=1347389 RepID=A0A4R8TDH6_9PEZI|nr:hypothetical protein C8034_v001527 [Colletotrichum sidae]